MPCQSFSQLHRPDWVSIHVALLLSAHLLRRNAYHRKCDHSQWHGRHWQDPGQGDHTRQHRLLSNSSIKTKCGLKQTSEEQFTYLTDMILILINLVLCTRLLNDALACSAHLAALPSTERRPHWCCCLLFTCAVAMGRLPGCLHLCGQDSSIMGRDCSRSCDGHSGIASREWRESMQLHLSFVW